MIKKIDKKELHLATKYFSHLFLSKKCNDIKVCINYDLWFFLMFSMQGYRRSIEANPNDKKIAKFP